MGDKKKRQKAKFDRRRIYTAALALLGAGAAGHFMQKTAAPSPEPSVVASVLPQVGVSTPTPETKGVVATPAVEQSAELAPIASPRPVPRPVDAGLESQTASIAPADLSDQPLAEELTRAATTPLMPLADVSDEPAKELVFASTSVSDTAAAAPEDAAPDAPEIAGCAIDVQGSARPGALLHIAVTAPCHSGETLAFDHAGLKFTEQLGPDGTLSLEMPAFQALAEVDLRFADGTDQSVAVTLPDFDQFHRIAVVWQGALGLQLHAMEATDHATHVWADTPSTPQAAITGAGGFVSVLGSAPEGYSADIYTYPASLFGKGEALPDISVEAEVMDSTCGQELTGQILRTGANGAAPFVEELSLTMPDCTKVGQYIALNNLPVTLRLAQD